MLIMDASRAISGGVNAFVIHGSPYSYSYPNTTWPGYTTFIYQFSEQYQRHQPGWENGYKEAMDWLGRVSFVMQSGIPKKHLVWWDKETFPDENFPNLYFPIDLIDAGYMYSYLSPDNFALPQAVVTNGILAEAGPGYRALLLRQNLTLTVDGVAKMAEFAKAGLPIIAAGGFPEYFSAENATANEFVSSTLKSISDLPNVHIVADAPVGSVVQSIGIVPLTQVNAPNATWWTTWRTTNTTDYVFIFNDQLDSVGSIKFASIATPYFFDAWTGKQEAVLNYTVDTGSATTEIAFSLRGNQTVIVAFSNESISGVEVPAIHFTSAPQGVVGFSYSSSTGLVAKLSASVSTGQALKTSDGKQVDLDTTSVPDAFELTNWDLTAEHWDPPKDLSDIDIIAVKYNTTHTNLTYPLLDWNSVPGLANTSGVGSYSTSLTWPPTSATAKVNASSMGALLIFKSPVLHTLRLSINSVQTPPVDPTNPTIDISPYLKTGLNTVEAKISTIMYNGLVPILEDLRTAGSGLGLPRSAYPAFREVGLVGSVEVVPYVKVEVATAQEVGSAQTGELQSLVPMNN